MFLCCVHLTVNEAFVHMSDSRAALSVIRFFRFFRSMRFDLMNSFIHIDL